jgi:hypothetical protein
MISISGNTAVNTILFEAPLTPLHIYTYDPYSQHAAIALSNNECWIIDISGNLPIKKLKIRTIKYPYITYAMVNGNLFSSSGYALPIAEIP